MKVTAVVVFAASALVQARASPIAKVLQLLTDLSAKIIKEGEDAQKVYSDFSEWCEERSGALNYEIKTGKSSVAELQAAIAQETATAESLQAKLEQLAGDIATDEADLKAATHIRTTEETNFAASEKELAEIVDTLRRAIRILEREMKKGGASMLQFKNAGNLADALKAMVNAAMLSTSDAGRLTTLLQSSQQDADASDDVGAPAAATYESHSSGIVETLTDLLEKAEGQLDDTRKKETQDKNAFEMLKQSLEDEIKYANKELGEAKAGIAAASEKKSVAEGDLQVTAKDLKGDISALSDLHHECMRKAEDFEAETKSRGEELTAIAKAKEVITDNVGAAEDLSYGLNQVSFLQSASATGSGITTRTALVQFEVVRLVRDLARKQNAPSLAQLASRLRLAFNSGAGEDIFAKVRGLIQDMIEKLETEANADAKETAFCNTELAETNAKKESKEAELQKLTTQIDQMSARSAQLKEEVAALQKALAELASSQAEMDKIRSEEKASFATNKADMEQGIQGVKMALKVLTEYYAKEGKAHSAADGAGTGIISLLEVVESDFTKGLAEMTATEESAQATYEQQTKENEIERATKDQDVSYKTKESKTLDKDVAETTSDRSSVQAELDAVMQYLKNLEGRCIAKAETFEQRKARYEAEIDGLREALRILESETAALVQRGASLRRLRGVRRHVV